MLDRGRPLERDEVEAEGEGDEQREQAEAAAEPVSPVQRERARSRMGAGYQDDVQRASLPALARPTSTPAARAPRSGTRSSPTLPTPVGYHGVTGECGPFAGDPKAGATGSIHRGASTLPRPLPLSKVLAADGTLAAWSER